MHSITILSIDPGTQFTGVAVLELYADNSIYIHHIETIASSPLIKDHDDVIYIHGERFTRILVICKEIEALLFKYMPQLVVSEASYFNPKRPQAFKALTEILTTLRLTVFQYNLSVRFETTDPSTVKNSLNVKGNVSDKSLMHKALKTLNVSYDKKIDINSLDEHSVDATAVGYSKCQEIINKY